jgi:hypothetical protein
MGSKKRKEQPKERGERMQRERASSKKKARQQWEKENPGRIQGAPGLKSVRGRQGVHTDWELPNVLNPIAFKGKTRGSDISRHKGKFTIR